MTDSKILEGNHRALFYRSLATMLSAGITLHRCLELLAENEPSTEVRELFVHLCSSLVSGSSFSAGMRKRFHSFGILAISMVEVGERTGALYLVLNRLADYEERSLRLRKKLKSQLTYPLFLSSFAFLALLLLPGFCLEGIFSMLKAQRAELPALSKLFYSLSRATHSIFFWLLLGLSMTSFVLVLRRLWDSDKGRSLCFRLIERFPPARKVLQSWQVSIVSDCLSLQLEAGVSPLSAFPIAAQATGDLRAVESSERVVEALEQGETISASLEHWSGLPLIFRSTAYVGEESGNWSALLRKLANFYDTELEDSLDRLVTLLEPVALCVMGLVFGLIIVATMTPMLELMKDFV